MINVKEWQRVQQMATIGEFTTGIVHDLKNQLACIGANMSLVEVLSKQDKINECVLNVQRQVGYANEMIEFMLKMGTQDVLHVDFDLALLMEDVATFLKRVSGHGITIKTYVDEATHLITGCQSLISNSILNLCANARDAIGTSCGTIEVSLMQDCVEKIAGDLLNQNISGLCSILTVKDTGCGIVPDQLDEIFQPFFTTKGNEQANTGMGLTNVIHTAREHGAGLTVASEVGVGTTFKLYFKTVA